MCGSRSIRRSTFAQGREGQVGLQGCWLCGAVAWWCSRGRRGDDGAASGVGASVIQGAQCTGHEGRVAWWCSRGRGRDGCAAGMFRADVSPNAQFACCGSGQGHEGTCCRMHGTAREVGFKGPALSLLSPALPTCTHRVPAVAGPGPAPAPPQRTRAGGAGPAGPGGRLGGRWAAARLLLARPGRAQE